MSAIAEVEQFIDCLINRDSRLQIGPVMMLRIPELRRLLERARKEDLFGLIDVAV